MRRFGFTCLKAGRRRLKPAVLKQVENSLKLEGESGSGRTGVADLRRAVVSSCEGYKSFQNPVVDTVEETKKWPSVCLRHAHEKYDMSEDMFCTSEKHISHSR